jgi:hypothetical protein
MSIPRITELLRLPAFGTRRCSRSHVAADAEVKTRAR